GLAGSAPRHRRLLRAGCQRLRDRRTAKQRHEIAPSHLQASWPGAGIVSGQTWRLEVVRLRSKMSTSGHKRTSHDVWVVSALPPKTDINGGLMHRSKGAAYSTTSS